MTLAASGYLNPSLAALLMVGSSLFVIANTARLNYATPHSTERNQASSPEQPVSSEPVASEPVEVIVGELPDRLSEMTWNATTGCNPEATRAVNQVSVV